MGVDSGLPDFRGNEGFWKAYPPIKKLGLSFSSMANPEWFAINPPLAWAFYGHRFNLYRKTVPHAGFQFLLDLVHRKNDNYFIFTSNVDGQFQKAGFDAERIVEVHGSIHYRQCSESCTKEIWEAEDEDMEVDMELFEAITIPLCPRCGDIARPNILMFGDGHWLSQRSAEQEARFYKWAESLKQDGQKLAIIEIGAGTAIPTVRWRAEEIVSDYADAKLIRINPREFGIDDRYGFGLPYGGLEGLKQVLE